MKSTTVAAPVDVSTTVSRISVRSRYDRVIEAPGSTASISHRPCSDVPRSAAKHAEESKRGQQSQSIEPARDTRAAVSQSPINA
jgi:hypothetical protein